MCLYIYIYLPINLKRRFRNYPKPVIVVFRLSLGTQFHLLCIYLGIMVIHEFKCMSSSRDVFCLWILSGLQCEILPLTSFPGGCAYCTSMEMHWSQCAVSMQHGIQVQEKRTAFSSSYEMIEQTKWLKCYVWIAYRKNMLKSFLRSILYHKFLKKLLGGRRFSQVFKAVVELLVPLFCMSEILVFYCLLPTILEILQLRSHFSSVTCVGQLIASKFFIHQRTHPKKKQALSTIETPWVPRKPWAFVHLSRLGPFNTGGVLFVGRTYFVIQRPTRFGGHSRTPETQVRREEFFSRRRFGRWADGRCVFSEVRSDPLGWLNKGGYY